MMVHDKQKKKTMKHGKTTNKKHQEAMKWRKLRIDPWTPH